MDKAKLKEILDKHLKWVRNEHGGSRADLSGADLSGADLGGADLGGAYLSGAYLSGAYLRGADLRRADIGGANLSGAYLRGADLRRADLRGANLSGAYLSGADLSRAYLSGADLSGADLSGADLSGADLSGAYLRGANLSGAYLRGADLSRAYLSGADLSGAYLRGTDIPIELVNKFYPLACPDSGAFIGYKKCCGELIVKLEILETAKRSSAFGRKCRCSAAKVLCIENTDETPANTTEAVSGRDSNFIYRVGEIVSVDDFDEDRRNECSTGIHFFITRQEAVDYVLC